jgi:meiotic recombination protein REC8
LQDDPSFLPDFALPPPELLADLDLAIPLVTPQSGESQSLTPFGSQVVPGTRTGSIAGLILPSSSSRDLGDFRLAGDNGLSSVGGSGLFVGEDLLEPLAEPDFGFDADGNFVDHAAIPVTPNVYGETVMQSDAGASERVRQEHEVGQMADVEVSLTADFHCDLHLCFTPCLLFLLLSRHFIYCHPSA